MTFRQRRRTAAAALVGAGLAVVALLLRDPHHPGSWGRCPFLVVTGLPCPLCGGLRAVHDLVHGHVEAALRSNAVVALAVPVALAWLCAVTVRPAVADRGRSRRRLLSAVAVTGLAVSAVARWLAGTAWS